MSILRIIGTSGLVISFGLTVVPEVSARPYAHPQTYGERLRDLGRAEADARRSLIQQANCQRKQLLQQFIEMKRCDPHHIPEITRDYVRQLQAINRWYADENLQLIHHFRRLREQARQCHLHGGHHGHLPERSPYGVAGHHRHAGVAW